MAARIAMMAIVTSNSIKVNPAFFWPVIVTHDLAGGTTSRRVSDLRKVGGCAVGLLCERPCIASGSPAFRRYVPVEKQLVTRFAVHRLAGQSVPSHECSLELSFIGTGV